MVVLLAAIGGNYLMPPRVFSTLTCPIVLSTCCLTFLRSSRFAGMTSFSVVLRFGSAVEELDRREIANVDLTSSCVSWVSVSVKQQ